MTTADRVRCEAMCWDYGRAVESQCRCRGRYESPLERGRRVCMRHFASERFIERKERANG